MQYTSIEAPSVLFSGSRLSPIIAPHALDSATKGELRSMDFTHIVWLVDKNHPNFGCLDLGLRAVCPALPFAVKAPSAPKDRFVDSYFMQAFDLSNEIYAGVDTL